MLQNSQPLYGDPLVQLRHVCKKIVVWLRTLYCWSRMLPCYRIRGQSLRYQLTVCDDLPEVPSFKFTTAPSVPTAYGVLQWRVWYCTQVPKVTPSAAMPIPTSAQQITKSAPISCVARSAPTRDPSLAQQYPAHSSYDRPHHLLQKAQSQGDELLVEEKPLNHRSALHDPPSYGYQQHQPIHPLSSSPFGMSPGNTGTPPLSSTPPPALSGFFSSPPGKLIPPRTSSVPPFQGLPTALQDAGPSEIQSMQQALHMTKSKQHLTAPPTSLDLLHSSPFKTNPSMTLSSLGESDYLKASTHHEIDDDDMPFAVDDDCESPAAVQSLAQKLSNSHRLQILESEPSANDLMSLTQQLQDFKAFGASLNQ